MKILFIQKWFLYYSTQVANSVLENNEVFFIHPKRSKEVTRYGTRQEMDYLLESILDAKITKFPLDFGQNTLDFNSYKSLIKIIRIVDRVSPDVIHLQESTFSTLFLVKLFPKIKFVYTAHDPKWHSGEKPSIFQSKRHFKKYVIQSVDSVIVHGFSLKKDVLDNFRIDSSKISVVPHITFSFYKKLSKIQPSGSKYDLLFFGRINKYKGIDIFLKSLENIVKKFPELRVLIAGKFHNFERYKSRISSLGKNLRVVNSYIPNDFVSPIFRSSRIVVLPYLDATQSGVIPIAFSHGKPVVATNTGSLSEVVEEGVNGLLCEARNFNDLSDKILYLLNSDKNIKSFSENSRITNKLKLLFEVIGKKHIDVYNEII